MIDLSGLHRPAGYEGRVIGRKYMETGKWLIISAVIVVVLGVIIGSGTTSYNYDVGSWPVYLGLSVSVIFALGAFRKNVKIIRDVAWIVAVISTVQIIAKTNGKIEYFGDAVIIFGVFLALIGIYTRIRGSIIYNSYKQEYPFRKW
jgi:hypothetical protein